ncbi:MAG: transposase [Acidobacteria bacterium]|nr:transposase [Acidobacteriota bacterium]
MNQSSIPTRLGEYINAMLPDAHGHQRKTIIDFVFALIAERTCQQAALARCFGNFEAAVKRLSRLLHNERLDTTELARSHARVIVSQLPLAGEVRVALDWTIEGTQHLLVASLLIGRRAIPLYWEAYDERALKDRRSGYERELLRTVLREVLGEMARARLIITADRGFASVELIDLLNELKVSWVLRAKSSTKVKVGSEWRRLHTLKMRGNQRRRTLGRLSYCASAPRRLYVTQARARDRTGKWGIWHLVSNRNWSAVQTTAEYARRFGCEEGFRDSKRLLGFADARISDLQAWQRMFTLVAIAILILTTVGGALIRNRQLTDRLLRQVRARRRERSELSLVRTIAELLEKQIDLWELLSFTHKLNLEAKL